MLQQLLKWVVIFSFILCSMNVRAQQLSCKQNCINGRCIQTGNPFDPHGESCFCLQGFGGSFCSTQSNHSLNLVVFPNFSCYNNNSANNNETTFCGCNLSFGGQNCTEFCPLNCMGVCYYDSSGGGGGGGAQFQCESFPARIIVIVMYSLCLVIAIVILIYSLLLWYLIVRDQYTKKKRLFAPIATNLTCASMCMFLLILNLKKKKTSV